MPIQMNFTASPIKFVEITSPTTTVTVQELHDAIKEWEQLPHALSYPSVCASSGKADVGASVVSGIILSLDSNWRIRFWNGVGTAFIKDGTIVATSGYSGQPIHPTGGSDTTIVLNQVGGVIAQVGSGVTEQDKTDIIEGVWDEAMSGHTTSGTFGELLNMVDRLHVNKFIWDESNSRFNLYTQADALVGYLNISAAADGTLQRTGRVELI